MQEIAEWLEKLGMSEYAQRFAENDIDIEVLSELTDTDFVFNRAPPETLESSRSRRTTSGRRASVTPYCLVFNASAKLDR